MGCILQLAMMIYGIVVVVKGEFSVTRKRVIIGTTARVFGCYPDRLFATGIDDLDCNRSLPCRLKSSPGK